MQLNLYLLWNICMASILSIGIWNLRIFYLISKDIWELLILDWVNRLIIILLKVSVDRLLIYPLKCLRKMVLVSSVISLVLELLSIRWSWESRLFILKISKNYMIILLMPNWSSLKWFPKKQEAYYKDFLEKILKLV